jgi:broad-specificity NMP kinase
MQWLDVAGAPGVGKSTICDPLFGPHDIAPIDIHTPVEWHDFNNEVTRLLGLVRDHPSFVAAVRMNRRSMRKMAAVASMEGTRPYIQTGFVQRGLGFGWRLVDMGKPVEELWHFFRLMPASLGVVFLEADENTLTERNKARETVKETAHENRAFMAPLMQPAIEFAKEVLHDRRVPVWRIETTGDIDKARKELVRFADQRVEALRHSHIPACRPPYLDTRNPSAPGYRGKAPALSSPPVWW